GTLPDDRMTADEEDVAGEDDLLGWEMHEDVAARMGGADLDQSHRLAVDRQVELAFERLVGSAQRDAFEVEGPEDAGQELSEDAHLRCRLDQRRQRLGRR